MDPLRVLILAVVSVAAGVLASITGGTSLLTVPAMLTVGLEPHVAVGTNMLVVAALSAGSAARFAAEGTLPRRPTVLLTATAIPGSVLGASLAIAFSAETLRVVVSVAMLGMAAMLALRPSLGQERVVVPRTVTLVGTGLLAVWALYGGLFSGGYATVLTIGVVTFYGVPLVEAIGVAKVVNLAGSLAAAVVFITFGKVDWTVAVVMGLGAALGGWVGAIVTLRARPESIRKLFAAVIAALGIKIGFDRLSDGRASH